MPGTLLSVRTWSFFCVRACDTPELAFRNTAPSSAMLADWILSAAPGFDGEDDGDHEFQALPPRMTAVSATPATPTAAKPRRDCQFVNWLVCYNVSAGLSTPTRYGSSAATLWPALTTKIDPFDAPLIGLWH